MSELVSEGEILHRVSILVRFIRAARTKKMLTFTDTKAELTDVFKGVLAKMQETAQVTCKPYELVYSDLEKAVQSSDIKLVLEVISILEISATSGPLVPFELKLASLFVKNCMITAFPETRQKMMKTISAFF